MNKFRKPFLSSRLAVPSLSFLYYALAPPAFSHSVSDNEIHASLVARGTDRRQKDRLLSVQNEFFKFTLDPPRRRADRVPFDRQTFRFVGTRMSREGGKGFIAPMVDPFFLRGGR